MFARKLVFAKLIEHLLLLHALRRCVARYGGRYKVKSFSCLAQLLVMILAQLALRERLRDIKACLSAQPETICDMGIRGGMACESIANANVTRACRIYADFVQRLVRSAFGSTMPPAPSTRRLSFSACRCFRGHRSARTRPM